MGKQEKNFLLHTLQLVKEGKNFTGRHERELRKRMESKRFSVVVGVEKIWLYFFTAYVFKFLYGDGLDP